MGRLATYFKLFFDTIIQIILETKNKILDQLRYIG